MINVTSFTIVFPVLTVWTLLLTTPSSFAEVNETDNARAQVLLAKSVVGFEENKGQFIDQNNHTNRAVRYLFRSPGLNVQLRSNGFSYDSYVDEQLLTSKGADALSLNSRLELPKFGREESVPKNFNRKFHRVDVELTGANPNPRITASGEVGSANNYYTNGVDALGVLSYSKVLYADVYPNIDLEFFLTGTGEPEYQFYVRPGGNPNVIRLRYNGANATKLVNGKVELAIAHGTIKDHIPLSYLASSKKEVSVSYKQTGTNEFGFVVPAYSLNETLVIDPMPELSWGTYYGGDGYDEGHSVAVDGSGNVYLAGTTSSTTGIATSGSHQTSINGRGENAYLVKFNSSGVRLWGTYYGYTVGNLSVAVDGSGNVYIAGWTSSTTGIATSGSHQTSILGIQDACLVKFNSSGVRLWGTYYGGEGNEFGNRFSKGKSVAIDGSGNVYLAGSTVSTTGIATSGAHQTSYGGSTEDAYLVKFNSSGVRIWGTYYGGDRNDFGNFVAVDNSGNVYLGGQTNSTTAISTSDAHQTSNRGADDAFLVKFNSSGERVWGTYYGGNGFDIGYSAAVDGSGNVYLGGHTSSTKSISTSGSHQTDYVAAGDAFLVKFNSSGERVWGTYYGGSNFEEFYSVALDGSGNVYLAGTTSSTTGIATSDSHQPTLGGYADAYLVKFNSSGVRIWGTYYGGLYFDLCADVSIDVSGNVYLAGETDSDNQISTKGAHQINFKDGGRDAFLVRFSQFTTKVDEFLFSNLPKSGVEFELFPNPVSDYVFVRMHAKEVSKVDIMLTNLIGQEEILATELHISKGITDIYLNLKDFISGTYFIKVRNGKLTDTKKFEISK